MKFLWGEKKRQNYPFFNRFFLKCSIGKCLGVSLWVVLLFNPHCLNMVLGGGYLNTMSWTDSKKNG